MKLMKGVDSIDQSDAARLALSLCWTAGAVVTVPALAGRLHKPHNSG